MIRGQDYPHTGKTHHLSYNILRLPTKFKVDDDDVQENVADVSRDDSSSLEVTRPSENEYEVRQESGPPTPSRGTSQGEEE